MDVQIKPLSIQCVDTVLLSYFLLMCCKVTLIVWVGNYIDLVHLHTRMVSSPPTWIIKFVRHTSLVGEWNNSWLEFCNTYSSSKSAVGGWFLKHNEQLLPKNIHKVISELCFSWCLLLFQAVRASSLFYRKIYVIRTRRSNILSAFQKLHVFLDDFCLLAKILMSRQTKLKT